MHESYISNKDVMSECKWVSHCDGFDHDDFPDKITDSLLSGVFFTTRMKMLSTPDGFILYGTKDVGFFSTSELLQTKLKSRLRLIRAGPNFYMVSENPIISLGNVDCSLYTSPTVPKDDYHKMQMDLLANTLVEFNHLEN